MKKIFCILLAVMLLSLFTACGCSTNADAGGNTGNNAGENGRMYDDGIIDGDNERTNDGSMQGGASAEFEIGGSGNSGGSGGNSGNSGNGGTSNGGSGGSTANGSGRRTSSIDKGELSQLASLVGANDFKVIEKLGEGDPEIVISGNLTVVKNRTYNMPVFGNKQTVTLSYSKEGTVENISFSPTYAPILWSMNISNEYGIADKISTDGLDYDYYSVWRGEKEKIELICWNDTMSVQITKA